MAKCRLCHNDRVLCHSHIVPEFLYRDLYNEQHKFIGVAEQRNKGWKFLQKGIREYLFCSDCEQHLNEKFEKPFLQQWTIDSPLPNRMKKNSAHLATYDYRTFKLFHLSVLFRSSVSTLPIYEQVNLGMHEERIRKMLVLENPGQDWEYSILAFAVLNGRDEVEKRLISRPISGKFEGHIAYGHIYGGAMWWVIVSSHRSNLFCSAGLQPCGYISIVAEPWNEIGVIQDIRDAYKRANI